MEKIRAFVAALIMLAIFVAGVHELTSGMSLKLDNGRFGFWYNPYKDLSYCALSDNIGDDTVLVMGSSEFRHGRNTKYHPKNALKDLEADIMTIGGPCNQMLFHSIALGSLEEYLRSKKVVLLVSLTWFKKNGVSPTNYGIRFSESEYIHFMENNNIDSKTKEYVAKRSEKLLKNNGKYNTKLKIINRYLLSDKPDFITQILFKFESILATDRDMVTTAVTTRGIRKMDAVTKDSSMIDENSFDRLMKEAEAESGNKTENPFYMSDKSWKGSFEKSYKGEKGAHPDSICIDSPEFDDLQAFLDIAKQSNVDVKLVIMPVNGRWFDYIGADAGKRQAVTDKIMNLASQYDAEVADLTGQEYDPYITKDATHPWDKGWVGIDREIYRFCTES